MTGVQTHVGVRLHWVVGCDTLFFKGTADPHRCSRLHLCSAKKKLDVVEVTIV